MTLHRASSDGAVRLLDYCPFLRVRISLAVLSDVYRLFVDQVMRHARCQRILVIGEMRYRLRCEKSSFPQQSCAPNQLAPTFVDRRPGG